MQPLIHPFTHIILNIHTLIVEASMQSANQLISTN